MLNKDDLNFILKQIKIAENHVATNYTEYVDAQGVPIPSLLPWGLRTVSGQYNNLVNPLAGSADQPMPRLLDPYYRDAEGGTSYTQTAGVVIDSQPRTVSNLVVDQSLNNDSAILAALEANKTNNSQQALAEIVAARDAAAADPADAGLQDVLQAKLDQYGVVVDNGSVVIPNVATDVGQGPPFSGFMTLFGQFFDHGLDLTDKGGNGLVFVPLQPDDPLYDPESPTNFMVLTRATRGPGADGVLGTADDTQINRTTPFIDQNQTYTSHESHQVFLREYVLNADGVPVATGRLLTGADGGLATWADVKAQAANILGIQLSDHDVHRVPLVATDLYGNFIPGANGFPQLVTGTPDAPVLVEGNPLAPVLASSALATGHAFLVDIAHNADPGEGEEPDANFDVSTAADVQPTGTYDDELLDQHFVVGDGRGNENIGLTAVHHVFHSEHNQRVAQIKDVLLSSGDVAFLNEWLLTAVDTIPADTSTLQWDGERLFQAARFSTEMVYQHLVFEEFVRTVSPTIDAFGGTTSVDIDPAIVSEFANVVYRFGHSMLTETVDRLSADGQTADPIGLIEAFLNPVEFSASGLDPDAAAGAIIRGMTRQVGNEIDEFVTGALRNNLVGLPLDLATLNMTRAREAGVPSLNVARAQFFEQTGDSALAPYASWADFALHLKHPASIINFIAAYGTHDSITSAPTLEAKRDAATLLVFGGAGEPADRLDFLNAEGAYAGGALGGLNDVDFWIGGLAEQKMPFGGMLGTTFNFVFEVQMEKLQTGDRFYYLSRAAGLNLLNELEADSFAELVMRNTDLGQPGATHLPGAMFLQPDYILELDQTRQNVPDPVHANPVLQAMNPMVVRRDLDNDGDGDYLRYTGNDQVVLGGTSEDDTLIGGLDDDTLWGDEGDDRLEGGAGNDRIFGGDGNDIITDSGSTLFDTIHGDAGHDVINGGGGLDVILGGSGQDFVFGGTDTNTITGGLDNDFLAGATGGSLIHGSEGDDWLEGGAGVDTLFGDNGAPLFNSTLIGHDVLNGRGNDGVYNAESGDDIMFQGPGVQTNNGLAGFDWAIHKGDSAAANTDLGIPIFVTAPELLLLDRFDQVEGLSGWIHDDTLTGRDVLTGGFLGVGEPGGLQPDPAAPFLSYANVLTEEGVARIAGLDTLVAHLGRATLTVGAETINVVVLDPGALVPDVAGNLTMIDTPSDILLGGGGSDRLWGMSGDDIIDGDRWLNVKIRVNDGAGNALGWADDMSSAVRDAAGSALYGGRALSALMLDRTLNPGQLVTEREIVDGDEFDTGVDTAVFGDVMTNYTLTLNADGSITVAHITALGLGGGGGGGGAQIRDGIDRVFNCEYLEFGGFQFAVANLFNTPPEIISDGALATAAVAIEENTTLATTISVLDVDGPSDPIFEIVGGADAALFELLPTATPFENGLSFITAPDFELPADADGDGVYEVTVQVGDGSATDTQTLSVTVLDVNEAPTITSDPVATVDENTTFVTTVTALDSDVPAQTISYGIAGGADAALFQIDATTGDLSFVAAPDFDLPGDADGDNVYDVSVEVSDGLVAATQALSVTVLDVNEPPTITSDPVAAVDENTTFVTTVTALDTDVPAQTLSYAIAGGADAALFEIDATTGDLTFLAAPDFETPGDADGDNIYDVTVEVGDGAATDTQTLSITVLDVAVENTAPTFSSDPAPALDENTTFVTTVTAVDTDVPAQTLSYAIAGGADAALFQIDATTGDLSFIDAPDFETPGDADGDNLYDVTVAVDDGSVTVTQDLIVTLNNVDEAGSGTVGIASYVNTGATASLTATNDLADPDGIVGGIQYQWQRQVGGIWQNIAGATAATVTGLSNATVRVTASYDDGFGLKTVASSALAVITGTTTNNTVVGTAADDLILGLTGNDLLTGAAGNDIVDGGGGGDTLFASINDGDDDYRGGAGTDTYSLGGTSADATVDLGVGTASSAQTGNDTLTSIERVVGGSGNDLLIGSAGVSNRLTGGAGNDTYQVQDAGDVVVEAAGGGTDTVQASVTHTLATNVENLTLLGLGNINGTGNGGANILTGNAGNNVLNGGGGADRLIGGVGVDALTGGAGRDTFAFAAGDSSASAATFDSITDYAKGGAGIGDLIDFSAALTRGGSAAAATATQASINQTTGVATFAAGSGGTLADAIGDIAARFTAATDAAGEFALFRVGGAGNYHLFVSDGVAGVGANDVHVELVGVTTVASINLAGGDLTITA
ncbi:peroxidase family protein [Methylotetracoccus oryzae]|uniref:peroxidase family protein n=1 Tax=Methylotetracoccus oryzae TaxID=1919059 RepID=UPI0019147D30|nr:peroxidase family protein [Methylotetracoccus oryzae]